MPVKNKKRRIGLVPLVAYFCHQCHDEATNGRPTPYANSDFANAMSSAMRRSTAGSSLYSALRQMTPL